MLILDTLQYILIVERLWNSSDTCGTTKAITKRKRFDSGTARQSYRSAKTGDLEIRKRQRNQYEKLHNKDACGILQRFPVVFNGVHQRQESGSAGKFERIWTQGHTITANDTRWKEGRFSWISEIRNTNYFINSFNDNTLVKYVPSQICYPSGRQNFIWVLYEHCCDYWNKLIFFKIQFHNKSFLEYSAFLRSLKNFRRRKNTKIQSGTVSTRNSPWFFLLRQNNIV